VARDIVDRFLDSIMVVTMEFPSGNKKFVEAIFLEVVKLSTRNLL